MTKTQPSCEDILETEMRIRKIVSALPCNDEGQTTDIKWDQLQELVNAAMGAARLLKSYRESPREARSADVGGVPMEIVITPRFAFSNGNCYFDGFDQVSGAMLDDIGKEYRLRLIDSNNDEARVSVTASDVTQEKCNHGTFNDTYVHGLQDRMKQLEKTIQDGTIELQSLQNENNRLTKENAELKEKLNAVLKCIADDDKVMHALYLERDELKAKNDRLAVSLFYKEGTTPTAEWVTEALTLAKLDERSGG